MSINAHNNRDLNQGVLHQILWSRLCLNKSQVIMWTSLWLINTHTDTKMDTQPDACNENTWKPNQNMIVRYLWETTFMMIIMVIRRIIINEHHSWKYRYIQFPFFSKVTNIKSMWLIHGTNTARTSFGKARDTSINYPQMTHDKRPWQYVYHTIEKMNLKMETSQGHFLLRLAIIISVRPR